VAAIFAAAMNANTGSSYRVDLRLSNGENPTQVESELPHILSAGDGAPLGMGLGAGHFIQGVVDADGHAHDSSRSELLQR